MILDAGVLISVERGEDEARKFVEASRRSRATLHTTHPVVAQAWREGRQQARLATFLKSVELHPFDDGKAVGRLLGRAGTSDVVDAHLVLLATRLGHDILTGDLADLADLVVALGAEAPTIHRWN